MSARACQDAGHAINTGGLGHLSKLPKADGRLLEIDVLQADEAIAGRTAVRTDGFNFGRTNARRSSGGRRRWYGGLFSSPHTFLACSSPSAIAADFAVAPTVTPLD
jgi:hypothetical protein